MKLFFLSGLFLSATILMAGLPPLPPMPSLDLLQPSSSSSKSLQQAPSSGDALRSKNDVVVENSGSSVPRIMIDDKSLLPSVDLKKASITTDIRSSNLDKIVLLLADLDKITNQFYALDQDVDNFFTAQEKELDIHLKDLTSIIGLASTKRESLADFLKKMDAKAKTQIDDSVDAKKRVETLSLSLKSLQEILTSLTPLIESAKSQQGDIVKSEDSIRQQVVDFRRKKSEFSGNYSKASGLKNDIIVQQSDGKKEIDGVSELLSTTKKTFDASLKKADEIKALIKTLKDLVAKSDADKKALLGSLDKVRKEMEVVGDVDGLINQFAADGLKKVVYKKSEDMVALTLKSENSLEVIDGKNMAKEVVGAIKLGLLMCRDFLVGAYYKIVGTPADHPAVVEKRDELKTATKTFVSGSVSFFSAMYSFVKSLFVYPSGQVEDAQKVVLPELPISAANEKSVDLGLNIKMELPELSLPKLQLPPLAASNASVSVKSVDDVKKDFKAGLALPPIDISKGSVKLPELEKNTSKDLGLPPLPPLKI
jgi:hypothetical protein